MCRAPARAQRPAVLVSNSFQFELPSCYPTDREQRRGGEPDDRRRGTERMREMASTEAVRWAIQGVKLCLGRCPLQEELVRLLCGFLPPRSRIDGCALGPESWTQVELGDLRPGAGNQRQSGIEVGDVAILNARSHCVPISQVIPRYVMCIEGNGDPPANMQYLGGVIATKQRPAAKITAYYRLSESEAWFCRTSVTERSGATPMPVGAGRGPGKPCTNRAVRDTACPNLHRVGNESDSACTRMRE